MPHRICRIIIILLLTIAQLIVMLCFIHGQGQSAESSSPKLIGADTAVPIDKCVAGDAASNYSLNTDLLQLGAEADSIQIQQAMLGQSLPLAIRTGTGLPRSKQYSHMRCLGDLEEPSNLEDRTCLFSNICYNRTLQDFVYYSSSKNDGMAPIIYDHRSGSTFLFPKAQTKVQGSARQNDGFVFLNYHRNSGPPESWKADQPQTEGGTLTWSPQTMDGPIPVGYKHLPGTFAFNAPHRDVSNLGHVLWEDAFPILVNMIRLGVYTPCLKILRAQPCQLTRSYGPPGLCNKFEDSFLRPLVGACGMVALFSDLIQQHKEDVCFEHLMVGGTYGAFDEERNNIGKEPYVRFYRKVLLAWHGVNPLDRPKSHQILLVFKKGQRRIVNFNAVASKVAEEFQNLAHTCYTGFADATVSDQLRMMQKTTVAVSPCGGISMMLPFLPEGSFVILMNYAVRLSLFSQLLKRGPHGECSECSWTMEAEFWRHVPHVNKMYYQVFQPSDFENGEIGRASSIIVDPDRLNNLIRSAIHEMEPY